MSGRKRGSSHSDFAWGPVSPCLGTEVKLERDLNLNIMLSVPVWWMNVGIDSQ